MLPEGVTSASSDARDVSAAVMLASTSVVVGDGGGSMLMYTVCVRMIILMPDEPDGSDDGAIGSVEVTQLMRDVSEGTTVDPLPGPMVFGDDGLPLLLVLESMTLIPPTVLWGELVTMLPAGLADEAADEAPEETPEDTPEDTPDETPEEIADETPE